MALLYVHDNVYIYISRDCPLHRGRDGACHDMPYSPRPAPIYRHLQGLSTRTHLTIMALSARCCLSEHGMPFHIQERVSGSDLRFVSSRNQSHRAKHVITKPL